MGYRLNQVMPARRPGDWDWRCGMPPNRKWLLVVWLSMYLMLLASLFACSRKAYVDISHAEEVKDTVASRLVPIGQVAHLGLSIGESLEVPELNFKVTRVSESQAFVQAPVRTKKWTETRTRFVPVKQKQVDKSRTDNRTYTDSNNKSKDKSKSNSGVSGNKVNLGTWWWLLLIALAIIVYRYRKFIIPFLRI